MGTPLEPEQSTAWMEPLAESADPDDLIDEFGQIIGSPANAPEDDE